jgi:hypothetical protein
MGVLAVSNNESIFADYYYAFYSPERAAGGSLQPKHYIR